MPSEAFTASVFIIMGTMTAVITKAGCFWRSNMTAPTNPNIAEKTPKTASKAQSNVCTVASTATKVQYRLIIQVLVKVTAPINGRLLGLVI